jgi:hypothetical protein
VLTALPFHMRPRMQLEPTALLAQVTQLRHEVERLQTKLDMAEGYAIGVAIWVHALISAAPNTQAVKRTADMYKHQYDNTEGRTRSDAFMEALRNAHDAASHTATTNMSR